MFSHLYKYAIIAMKENKTMILKGKVGAEYVGGIRERKEKWRIL